MDMLNKQLQNRRTAVKNFPRIVKHQLQNSYLVPEASTQKDTVLPNERGKNYNFSAL